MEIKVFKRIEKTTDHAGNDDYVVYYKNKNNEWEFSKYEADYIVYKNYFVESKEIKTVEVQEVYKFNNEILNYMSEEDVKNILNNDSPWSDFMNEFFEIETTEIIDIIK